jgi:hypothetical protein
MLAGRAPAALGPFDTFGSVGSQGWDKNKNWLLFREMSRADFQGTLLGQFIELSLVPHATKAI